jgi:hypothetical protein
LRTDGVCLANVCLADLRNAICQFDIAIALTAITADGWFDQIGIKGHCSYSPADQAIRLFVQNE